MDFSPQVRLNLPTHQCIYVPLRLLFILGQSGHGSSARHSRSMSPDISQIEENRRRERRAALAVADHDQAIILHLEKEVERLQAQHEHDMDLVRNLSDQGG